MTLKVDQLIDKIRENGLSLPTTGTGRDGKILKRDLERVLGDHFVNQRYGDDEAARVHLEMRRQAVPMKAYRYNKLNSYLQKEIFEDDNNWVMEQKFNGWRMLITFVPGDGFMFWGGNISDVDLLPTDYTEHVRLVGLHPRSYIFKLLDLQHTVYDAEALCYDHVEMLDGAFATNTLDAVKAILGSDPERAVELQKQHKIVFQLFDYLPYQETTKEVYMNWSFSVRRNILEEELQTTLRDIVQFELTEQHTINKKDTLRKIWSIGEEGALFKNKLSNYSPGGRLKDVAIKVKRTMSGEIGDDIDAFIIGYIRTTEWSKKNLIGGVKLGVYIPDGNNGERKLHHIATVTSMPDSVRKELTIVRNGLPVLHIDYYNCVLVVDGQELSARNQMILHATVDWERGFRKTKTYDQCTFDLEPLTEERF